MILVEGRDFSEHKKIEKNLKEMALHDPLTGLANRALLHEYLENTLAHAERNKKSFSVIFIDLDNFKIVNDSLGHQVGDELLLGVSESLKACLRGGDIIARVGGDEFVAVLNSEREGGDGESAVNVLRRLLQSISELSMGFGLDDNISASIGVSVYPKDGTDADTLLRNADVAMYQAKNSGKNCYSYSNTQKGS